MFPELPLFDSDEQFLHALGAGIIVTEVLVGLIDADPTSFRQHNPDWQPTKTLSQLLAS